VGASEDHIHIDSDLHAAVSARHTLAGTFGLVGDLPTHARTGCGSSVRYGGTSTDPEHVTCPPCRTYAHRRYTESAEYVVRIAGTPGTPPELTAQAIRARSEYLELARRYGGEPGGAPAARTRP